jgi:uncharacterized protein YdeI (YjbR/CyaY-like superfamily)
MAARRNMAWPAPQATARLGAMDPAYFATPDEWRAWLAEHHDTASELWVGFHKKVSGRPTITWPEAVDQALCFGWIDGVRKSVDDSRYVIRVTPRRRNSIWSSVNVGRVKELTRLGLMQAAGLAAYRASPLAKSGVYSYEQRKSAKLPQPLERRFKRNRPAWQFFQAQPRGYQRTAAWWVLSAKKEETRLRRLATLIEDSARGRPIKPLDRKGS